MTSAEVQRALCGFGTNCLWNPRRVLATRNSVGVVGWEADLLILQPSGWIEEIEIKISVSDFKADFSKHQKHRNLQRTGSLKHLVRRFWFAVPHDIEPKIAELVPPYAGLIVVGPDLDWAGRPIPRKHRIVPDLPGARKATDKERAALLVSVYYRFWRLKDEN